VRLAAGALVAWMAVPRPGVAQQGTPPEAPRTARLGGVVFDSIAGGALAGATVRVFRPGAPAEGLTATADGTGRFVIPALPTGTWVASFLHPRLDAWRVDPPLLRVEVVDTTAVALPLAIPSATSLARSLCGPTRDDSTAVLVGEVRAAEGGAPLAGATVRATWPEWVFGAGQMGREEAVRVARADSTGRFALCGVPQATTVTARAQFAGDSTGVIELAVPPGAYAVADFIIDARGLPAGTGDVSEAAPGALGRGMVRGTVRTPDGRPLAGALARILGSGSVVRADSAGTFRIADAVAGTQSLELRALGFELQRSTVTLVPGDVLLADVVLQRASVRLDTVRVAAGRTLSSDLVRLERRWRQGQGTILDAATVRERGAFGISGALMGLPGVRLGTRNGYGNTIYLRSISGGECRPPIFLDGFRFIAGDLTIDELVFRDDVAALEVYARPLMVPPELSDPLSGCGSVVVWTKSFFGNVPVLDPRKRKDMPR
jgi:hypothetical protein